MDYQKYINALRQCAKEHEYDRTPTGDIVVTYLCIDVADLLEALEQKSCSSEDCVSREFMYKLGATCIATRDKNDKLIALGTIENLPPVTPTRKKWKWIRTTDKAGHLVWECGKCGWQQRFNTNYCPDCGAEMTY